MKYRGKDGWLQDDSLDKPQRYDEFTSAPKPVPKKKPLPERRSCPNCPSLYSWRRKERYCVACGWGKTKKSENEKTKISDSECGYCVGLVAAFTIFPLMLIGMGYSIGGFGGMLFGAAIGYMIPTGFCIAALMKSTKKKEVK